MNRATRRRERKTEDISAIMDVRLLCYYLIIVHYYYHYLLSSMDVSTVYLAALLFLQDQVLCIMLFSVLNDSLQFDMDTCIASNFSVADLLYSQLSLAIPPRVGKMSAGDDYGLRQGRNGVFCVTVGPVTRTADILTQSLGCMLA